MSSSKVYRYYHIEDQHDLQGTPPNQERATKRWPKYGSRSHCSLVSLLAFEPLLPSFGSASQPRALTKNPFPPVRPSQQQPQLLTSHERLVALRWLLLEQPIASSTHS